MKLVLLAPLLLLPNSVLGLAVLPTSVEISNVASSDPTGKDLVVFRDDTALELEKRQVRGYAVRLITGRVRALGTLSVSIISYAAGALTAEIANKIAQPIVAEIFERGELLWRGTLQGRTCARRVTIECEENVEFRLVPT